MPGPCPVPVERIERAVKRNKDRFPPDFMVQLSPDEFESLRFHSGASSSWGGRRYLPYAFTQQHPMRHGPHRGARKGIFIPSPLGGGGNGWGGISKEGVAMLSSVLRSACAVQVNIEIMRAFVRLRRMVASNAELARRLHALEKQYDAQFKTVFDAIRALMMPPEKPRPKRIGFRVEETKPSYRTRRLRRTPSRPPAFPLP